MPTLEWDRIGTRVFQSGLDRGVIYLEDGSAVPWSGLISVEESPEFNTTQVYFDGQKIHDLVDPGDYAASITAVTYPDVITILEGYSSSTPGVFYGEQPPGIFNMTYRSMIGNDVDGDENAYKIHILYNVTAVPKDKVYATVSDDPALMEFEWDITAVPEEIPGHKPSAHIVIDTRKVDPTLIKELEKQLYGSLSTFASLPSLTDMVDFISNWFLIKVVDNGDGTWTAVAKEDGYIVINPDGSFQITEIDAVYLDADTYKLFTTRHAADSPLISIEVYSDGSWTATSDHENLVSEDENGVFTINNATAIFAGPDMYRVSDTY